ncbi:hypothetical protein HRbin10_00252 [bacterium HR10]|nr:hypothetical protein HRbin10_00252 [bacterium HR10]
MRSRRIAILTLSLVGLLEGLISPFMISAQARMGASPPRRLVRTFSVGRSPGVILVNSSLRGNISVQAWERWEIHLTATAPVDARFSNDILTVSVPKRRAIGSDAVDIDVKVPADCVVEASTIRGKITIRGVRGHLKLSSMEGDIELVDVASPNIDAMSVTAGRITFSGKLQERGTYTFYSGAGTIELLLPEASSFTLDAATHEGRIETEGLRLQSRSQTPSHLQGIAQTGSALLKLRTHSGRIHVRHR